MYQNNVTNNATNYNQYTDYQYSYNQGQENNFQENFNQDSYHYYYNQEYPKYDTNQNVLLWVIL